MKRLIIFTLGVVLLMAAGLGLLYFSAEYTGTTLLMNKSIETILLGRLRVCGQEFEIRILVSGGETSLEYEVRGDCHYDVALTVKGGRTLNKGD